MKKKLVLASAALLLGASSVFAQRLVKGRVTTPEGDPVMGATVRVPNSRIIVSTDENGNFTLSNVPAGTKKLTISSIGMEGQTVDVADNLNIVLKSNNDLGEVIVVAYGTAKKGAYTGSAGVVKSAQIETRLVSDVSKAIAGTVSGVQGVSANGQPGTSATIRVRGFGSINAGMSPLYVVDNVPYDGDISAINPQDIESLTVLKDAASAALYGARGANGVVIITTKKGKEGDARISFDARWGVNSRQIKNYNVMTSPAQYMETLYSALYNEGYQTLGYTAANAHAYANNNLHTKLGYPVYTVPAGAGIIGLDGRLNPAATLGYNNGTNLILADDWEKATFSNGLRQEYNFNVSGGTERLNYYLSAGYLSDEGIIPASGFDRISTRAVVDYQARKWLKIGTNLAYTYNNSKYPSNQTSAGATSSNAFFIANGIAPVYPLYVRDANGNIKRDEYTGNPIYDYGNGAQTIYTRNYNAIANPLGDLTYETRNFLMDIFTGSWYATVTPIEGLSITGRLSLSVDNTRFHLATSNKYGQSANSGGSAQQEHTRTSGFNQQYLANYRRSFGLNNFDFLLGYESYDYRTENLAGEGKNLYRNGVWAINNTIDNRYAYGGAGEYSTRGIFFRTNYDYDGRYFGSFSFRRDASSRFHPDHRWGSFWSASVAWEMKRENFLQSQDWINSLKLKASYGQQGNDNIGNSYAYIDQYTLSGSNGVFSDGTLAYKGNPNLTWEKTNSFNIGVDFTLWNGLLSGTVEYFSRQTADMLYNRPVAMSNGYRRIPENVGSMRNSGVEFDLHSKLVDTDDFRWTVDFNGTLLKNKILELSPRTEMSADSVHRQLIDGSRIYKEGESMYNVYTVKYAGVDQATGLALYWAKDDNGKEYATSDYNLAYNGNRQDTGDLLPVIFGGFGTSVYFKGFDLSATFGYQLGGKIFDNSYQTFMHGGDAATIGSNWHKDIAKAWTPNNTVTDVPRLNSSDKYTNSFSTRWLVSSNYLSVNNVTLGYTFASHVAKRIGMESLRLYVSGDNLAILTARKGLDPRQDFTSSSNDTYSALRSLSFGIKLGF